MAQKPLQYIYFDARARGELPRLVAAFCGLKLDDQRVEFKDWDTYKHQTPYNQLPCLVVDGKWYAQKLAIAQYLADIGKKDLLGKTPKERLQLHHCLYFSEDVLEQLVLGYLDRDCFDKGTKLLDAHLENVVPGKLAMMEKELSESASGYFVGGRLTLADLAAFDLWWHLASLKGDSYLEQFPQIKASFDRTANLPGIREYLDKGKNRKQEWDH